MSETNPWTYLMDMDGVLVTEEKIVPGADTFLAQLRENGNPFMVFTNNSIYTPRDLRARLQGSGIDIPEEAIWTSALATAQFLHDQREGGSAYVVGEAGLTTALYNVGYTMSERNPDYVVLGETRTYSFTAITRAIRLIEGGARAVGGGVGLRHLRLALRDLGAGVARIDDPVVVEPPGQEHRQRLGVDLRFDRGPERGVGRLVDLLAAGLGGGAADDRQHACQLGAAHHRGFGAGPGEHEPGVVGASAHSVVPGAVGGSDQQ